ncbi:hypothetical protein GHT06_013727 [Daphnia sinensis]|uniref:Uncharacterized protein n=1 Tax=Daphnia sinensis TaxID=1820382 RepID=A0AAD5KSM0_9CRUS|nr:hypothetical protein GHT06_013727 [Daphnia sinensis]
MEAESDSAQGGCAHYPRDADMMTTNYRHRRHYAVRRKLGRAKTARLAAPVSLASDAADGTANAMAGVEGGVATPSDDDVGGRVKCDLNDSAECDNDEDESIGESDECATCDEETSADDEDEESDIDDDDVSSSTACASRALRDECVVSQLLTDGRIVQRFNRPAVPVITVVDQPGPSTEDTFFDYAPETLSAPLLYPLDERDSIAPHYFAATR